MSYARFGKDSDIYLFHSVYDRYECCGCLLRIGDLEPRLTTLEQVLEHLHAHRAAGHDVPEYTFDRVRRELAEGAVQ